MSEGPGGQRRDPGRHQQQGADNVLKAFQDVDDRERSRWHDRQISLLQVREGTSARMVRNPATANDQDQGVERRRDITPLKALKTCTHAQGRSSSRATTIFRSTTKASRCVVPGGPRRHTGLHAGQEGDVAKGNPYRRRPRARNRAALDARISKTRANPCTQAGGSVSEASPDRTSESFDAGSCRAR